MAARAGHGHAGPRMEGHAALIHLHGLLVDIHISLPKQVGVGEPQRLTSNVFCPNQTILYKYEIQTRTKGKWGCDRGQGGLLCRVVERRLLSAGETRDFFYLILLEKNARPVCETRRPKKKTNASEIRVWVHLYPWAENGGHVAARAHRMSVHLFVSTWRPPMQIVFGLLACATRAESRAGARSQGQPRCLR